ncbi:MAG: hypothetical protein AAB728_05160 [Patescibacteria group bacterium]
MAQDDASLPATKSDLARAERGIRADMDKGFETVNDQFTIVLKFIQQTSEDHRKHTEEFVERLDQKWLKIPFDGLIFCI